MTPYVSDADFTLWNGDALEVLRSLPDEAVHCVVTSPPYWGLRDYGTGMWEGGEAECDHKGAPFRTKSKLNENWGAGFSDVKNAEDREPMRQKCSKCGARRVDQQLGLEASPDEYVAAMVNVFREVRRVLRRDGTVFLNLGDSYFGTGRGPSDLADDRGFHTKVTRDGFPTSGVYTHPTLKSKDLVGIPWRVAFALQADGWYLRSDIIWSKPNPMPESVTDRPTKAHEYVFLLSKSPRYFFDQEAVREPHSPDGRIKTVHDHGTPNSHANYDNVGNGNERWPNGGRNIRSVWEIATQPYPEAHFATFPEALVERCVKAGTSERGVCPECGAAWVRAIASESTWAERKANGAEQGTGWTVGGVRDGRSGDQNAVHGAGMSHDLTPRRRETLGWHPSCDHGHQPIGATVFDPFMGSGTTALVARRLGRRAVGIELNATYAEMAARRLQQLSLLAEQTA